MADLVHETELRLKDGISPKMPRVNSAILSAHASMKKLGDAQIGGGSFMQALGGPGLNVLKTAAAGFLALGGAMAGLSAVSMRNAADFESLQLALAAVEGSAGKATSAMADLKKIAMLPGLGFEEAVSGYLKLRNSGVDSGFSKQIIEAFGKANARSGGGKEQFDRIMLAVSQIALKPNLSGEELMQLNEANIPASRVIKERFGTTDGEALKKMGVTSGMVLQALTDEFSKMAGSASGAKNSFDNLNDAMKFASVAFGQGLNDALLKDVDSLSNAFNKLQESGALQALGEALGNMASSTLGDLTGGGTLEESMRDLTVATYEMGTYFRNFVENSKTIGDWAKEIWNHSPISEIAGKWGDDGGSAGVTGGPGEIEAFRGTLEMEARRRKQEAAKKEKEALATREKQQQEKTSADQQVKQSDVLKRQAAKLDQIAENTKPLRDIAERVLGAGGLARQHLSTVNLTHYGSRGNRMIQQGQELSMATRLSAMNRNGDFNAVGF